MFLTSRTRSIRRWPSGLMSVRSKAVMMSSSFDSYWQNSVIVSNVWLMSATLPADETQHTRLPWLKCNNATWNMSILTRHCIVCSCWACKKFRRWRFSFCRATTGSRGWVPRTLASIFDSVVCVAARLLNPRAPDFSFCSLWCASNSSDLFGWYVKGRLERTRHRTKIRMLLTSSPHRRSYTFGCYFLM